MNKKIVLLFVFCMGLIAGNQAHGQMTRSNESSTPEIHPHLDGQFRYVEPDRLQMCPNCNHQLPRRDIYGLKGNPYSGDELGGCKCGKRSPHTWYNAYHHWPSPMSVLADHGRHGCRRGCGTDTRNPRLRDNLEIFADVRLLPKVRRDNGYCGPECDPYGLVGKSRRGVNVASEPNQINR